MKQFYGFGRPANVNLSLVKRSVGILMAMALLFSIFTFCTCADRGYSFRHRAGSFGSCYSWRPGHADQSSHAGHASSNEWRNWLLRI